MAVVNFNVSLEEQVAAMLRKRSAEMKKPASRYLADLILEDAQRSRDELAEEGYQLLSADTKSFADAALPLAAEVWPEWRISTDDEEEAISQPK